MRRWLVGMAVLTGVAAGCNKASLVGQPVVNDPCANGGAATTGAMTLGQLWYRVHAVPTPASQGATGLALPATPSTASYAAPSATQLLQAMDMDMTTVTASNYSGNADQAAVFSNLGSGITPTKGSNFAFFSTGVAGANTPQVVDLPLGITPTTQTGTDLFGAGCSDPEDTSDPGYDCANLTVTFTVPQNVHSVQFDFNFLSAEYPEFVGTPYNDEFWVSEASTTYSFPNIVHDNQNHPININSAFFTESCLQLPNSGFDISIAGRDASGNTTAPATSASDCDAGATGLLTTKSPVKPGETVTLVFNIEDHSDGIYDSAVMLDNLVLSPDTVPNPTTGGNVDVTCLFPASGPVAGGTTVAIHGDGFVNVQSVYFGTTPATSYTVDSPTLIHAVTPAGLIAGPVDVKVTASPNGNVIAGTGSGMYSYQ